MAGNLTRVDVRANNAAMAIVMACIMASPAAAREKQGFSISAGQLGDALTSFGEQAGITIGVTDPILAKSGTRGLHGRFSTAEGLRKLLRGTGADFVFVDAQTVRVFRAKPPKAPKPPKPAKISKAKKSEVKKRPSPSPAPVLDEALDAAIIVTASKQNSPFANYPGTVHVVDLNPDKNAREAALGTAAIVAKLPQLATTSLGSGRNKIFIRGVADSSFNGQSQSTVGQYLGDVRLTYNAPDPNLNLYDIARVEILEGPQGTLYGTGALGGIIHLTPNKPDTRGIAASGAAGFISTAKGGQGEDAAIMVNMPIAQDRLAVRVVGYWANEPGYIADPGRGLKNINQTMTRGLRATVRYEPGDEWAINAGIVDQHIDAKDGQYILRGASRLTRNSHIAQPFDNDFSMTFVTVEKVMGDLNFNSTTSRVKQHIASVYDATGYPGATGTVRFDENINIKLFAHETRLSKDAGRLSWLVGLSGIYDVSRVRRDIGPVGALAPLTAVTNDNSELALFAKATFAVTPAFSATVGARGTFSRSYGELIGVTNAVESPKVNTLRASPTLAFSWRVNDRLFGFGRYQKAFRSGAVEVAPTEDDNDSQRFEADNVSLFELGLRLGDPAQHRFSSSASISYARWSQIQSDLVDSNGLPYTANIGDGRIYALEFQFAWRPTKAWKVDASAFLNLSSLTDPESAFASSSEFELPNIAHDGGQISLSHISDLSPNVALILDGTMRYVGKSHLGIGEALDVEQGGYVDSSVGARLDLGRWGISLDVTNVADVQSNRFAFGNPFGITERNQITPLRPRTFRIGIDAAF